MHYDVKKIPEVKNATIKELTTDRLLLTNFEGMELSVHNIALLPADSADGDAYLSMDVYGENYKQENIRSGDILHAAGVDTLYYARSMENYRVPAHTLALPEILSKNM